MKTFTLLLITAFLLALSGGNSHAGAQQMIYQPKNPAFGGNPGNYSWLMNSAQAQNQHKETATDRFRRDPLADFEASLQRQVLSQLTRDIVRQQLGDDGIMEESRFEFGEFTIDLHPGADGVNIVIHNILTGAETNITIPNF